MGLLIYTAQTTERLIYTFDFILGELLGLEYALTHNKEAFAVHSGPKFSYTAARLKDELFFESVSLLFEVDINLQPVEFIEYEDMVGFYPVSQDSDLPFDMFASTFVMISRYNEYLLHKKDKYDRYRASQSMNYIAGFLGKPMINYYGLELKKILGKRFRSLVFKQNKFEYIATFDVDMAYAYLGKSMKENISAFFRSLLMSNFRDIRERYRVGGAQKLVTPKVLIFERISSGTNFS